MAAYWGMPFIFIMSESFGEPADHLGVCERERERLIHKSAGSEAAAAICADESNIGLLLRDPFTLCDIN